VINNLGEDYNNVGIDYNNLGIDYNIWGINRIEPIQIDYSINTNKI
jgi:hypothetical protein